MTKLDGRMFSREESFDAISDPPPELEEDQSQDFMVTVGDDFIESRGQISLKTKNDNKGSSILTPAAHKLVQTAN